MPLRRLSDVAHGMGRVRTLMFLVGLAIPIAAASIVATREVQDPSPRGTIEQSATEDRALESRLPEERVDLQQEGPLNQGQRISLDAAKQLSPYRLPIPPTDESTGPLSGVWIDTGLQIAFVWETNLRYYVHTSEISESEALSDWTAKVAEEPQTWSLTTVRGHAAIGAERGESSPTSLTFIENGLVLQFVGPRQTLDELRQLAEKITYE